MGARELLLRLNIIPGVLRPRPQVVTRRVEFVEIDGESNAVVAGYAPTPTPDHPPGQNSAGSTELQRFD